MGLMVIGGGKTKALRNQRRRNRRNSDGPPGRGNPNPKNRRGKLGNLLRRILTPGKGRRKGK